MFATQSATRLHTRAHRPPFADTDRHGYCGPDQRRGRKSLLSSSFQALVSGLSNRPWPCIEANFRIKKIPPRSNSKTFWASQVPSSSSWSTSWQCQAIPSPSVWCWQGLRFPHAQRNPILQTPSDPPQLVLGDAEKRTVTDDKECPPGCVPGPQLHHPPVCDNLSLCPCLCQWQDTHKAVRRA